jgi:hypothetical protein
MFLAIGITLMTIVADLVILTATAALLYEGQLFLPLLCIWVWFKIGGFDAWKPSNFRELRSRMG